MTMDQSGSILSSYDATENALLESFKGAAVKVTNLYKESLAQNRKAYGAGYQQALQDLYEFITSHPSNLGVGGTAVPVEDILAFARQKNAQLMSELVPDRTSTTSSSSTTSTDHRVNVSNNHTNTSSSVDQNPSTRLPAEAGIKYTEATARSEPKEPFNPFRIDPDTQFTFTAPFYHHQHQWPWNSYMEQQENTMDGLKRRHASSSDISFMGRSLSNMNIDSWDEPPLKKGRSAKRENE